MKTRRPTVDEAVKIMKMVLTEQQRQINLAHWRHKFGDGYVRDICAKLEEKNRR